MPSLGVTDESLAAANLLAGSHPTIQIDVTIASGEGELDAGTVLGIVTASGEYAAYDDDASDGTQTAVAILAIDVDATSAAVVASAYVHGEFNEDALTGIDAAGKADLQQRGVYVKTVAA